MLAQADANVFGGDLPHRLLAVQGLPDDVGVPGVLGRLGDDVQEGPARRPAGALREPRRLGQRVGEVQVDGGDELVGATGDLVVAGEHALEGLVGEQPEARRELLDQLRCGLAPVDIAAAHRLGAVQDEIHPPLLDLGDVLDQPTQGQLAHGGALPRLVVGKPLHGVAQELPVHRECLQDVRALAGQCGGGHGGGLLDGRGGHRSASRYRCCRGLRYGPQVPLSDLNSRNLRNMANTSSRTLRLLSLLQTHRYWPGPELAGRLGVSVRTLRRDIDRLRELGYPVEASRGVDGGYQLAAGAALPPLVLDDEEAVALAVGLQAAAQGGVAGIAESSVRALTKVVQVMPPRLRRRVDALRAMTVPAAWSGPTIDADPDVLITLAQACRDAERLELGYTAASGEQSSRLVDPLRLVALGRRWYLVAYDLTRHDWRSFRVDRIEEARRTGARFRPRELPAEDAAAFVRAGVDRPPTGWSVEVLIDAPVAQ